MGKTMSVVSRALKYYFKLEGVLHLIPYIWIFYSMDGHGGAPDLRTRKNTSLVFAETVFQLWIEDSYASIDNCVDAVASVCDSLTKEDDAEELYTKALNELRKYNG